MARVFKQTYTKPIPEGVEIITRQGIVYARFRSSNGKMLAAPMSHDGKRMILETAKWYIDYKDADGTSKRKAGYTDKEATNQLATELERTAEHIRSGYKPKEHEFLNVALKTHLEDFKANMMLKGVSEKQVKHVHLRAKKIIEGCNFQLWTDISASKIQTYLASLRKDTDEKRGISPQTYNWYLQSVKAFCKWMENEGRAPENPLKHLKGINVKVDCRHSRRALTQEEVKKLLDGTFAGDVRYGMTGYERSMLYKAALASGLRASELKTLTVDSCDLDSESPTLTVKACYSKHRREDIQPILKSFAKELKAFIDGRNQNELLFPTMPRIDSLAKMIKSDLESVNLKYKNDAGHIADFHALRHTYITNLARAGIHPKIAMDLARHSDINLTLARYSHTLVADRASALEATEPTNKKDSQPQEAKATGTDDYVPKTNDDNKPDDKQVVKESQVEEKQVVMESKEGFVNRRLRVRVPSSALRFYFRKAILDAP
jgi:integrase/recombinase XerD